jgi:hypothetical protein
MKLTKTDKELLTKWGYPEEDMNQIEEATTKTVYELNDKKISCKKALEVLGREEFLSGISRSAFHWSSARNNEKGETVYFDSSKLFE